MTTSIISPVSDFIDTTEGRQFVGLISPAYEPEGGTQTQHPLASITESSQLMRGSLTTGIPLAGSIVGVVTSYSTFGATVVLEGDLDSIVTLNGNLFTGQAVDGAMVVNVILTGELANRAPVIQSVPTIQFTQGVASEYNLRELVTDPDGDVTTLTLSTAPGGLPAAFSFDPITGILSYDGTSFNLTGDEFQTWAGNRLIASDTLDMDSFVRNDVTMRGELSSTTLLTGNIVGEVILTGLLTGPADLVGQMVVDIVLTGELAAPIIMEGVMPGNATMSGTLTDIVPFKASITNNVVMTGILYAQVMEIKSDAIVTSLMSGTLTGKVLFEGTMLVEASGLGRLGPDYIFNGAQINSVEMVGKLTTIDKTSPWEQESIVGTEWIKEQPL